MSHYCKYCGEKSCLHPSHKIKALFNLEKIPSDCPLEDAPEWKDKQLYKESWEQWGELSQLFMAMEECSELIQAISKYYRTGNYENVAEELVDVKLVIESFEINFKPEILAPLIESYRDKKLKRLDDLLHKSIPEPQEEK